MMDFFYSVNLSNDMFFNKTSVFKLSAVVGDGSKPSLIVMT